MKNTLLIGLLCLFARAQVSFAEENSWSVVKNASFLSYTAEFAIKKGEVPLGKVVRSGLFTPRYFYDLYDTNNTLQMRGITRAFSLGFFAAWAMEIDLYEGDYLAGKIQGEIFTHSRAKFAFYDENGGKVATAYLNDESCNFLITSTRSGEVLSELEGKAYGDSSIWQMKSSDASSLINEKALQIFASFAADYQRNFIRPPKREIYYYHESHHRYR